MKCETALAPPVDELPAEDFTGPILDGRAGLVAVCFHARWCGFCRSFLPQFRARAAAAPVAFALADLSSNDDPRWDDFAIRAVPTLILFKDGEPVWRRDAALGVGLFERDIDRLIQAAAASSPPA